MRRLFTRKRKEKPGIKDALATLPTFVAVPQTPQPQISPSGGSKGKTHSSSGPPEAVRANSEEIATSTGAGVALSHSHVESLTNQNHPPSHLISTGTQSEGAVLTDDETDSEFGYATVRETDPLRTLDLTKSTQPLPDLPVSSPHASMADVKSRSRSLPSVRARDSDIDSPALSPNSVTPPVPSPITPEAPGSARTRHRDPIPTTAGAETLYAKVNKPPELHHASKKKHSSSRDDVLSPTSNSPHADSAQKLRRRHSPRRADSPSAGQRSRAKQVSSPVMTSTLERASQNELGPYYHKLTLEGAQNRHRTPSPDSRSLGVTVSQGRPDGRGSGVEVAEYTDEDYIPSGDDSFTLTDTSFSDDQLLLQHLSTSASNEQNTSLRPQQGKQRKFPTAAVSHRPPVASSPPPRPHTPIPGQHRCAVNKSPGLSQRPASAPETNAFLDNIPVIHPSFIQQVSPTRPLTQSDPLANTGEVYIFSEKQLDGTEQYYAATPVRSLSRAEQQPSFQSPPVAPPLASAPPATSLLTTPNRVEVGELESPHPPQSHYYSHLNENVTPSARRETVSAPTHTTLPVPMPSQHSRSTTQGGQGTVVGTKITKLGSPVGGRGSPIVPQSVPGANLVTSPRDLKQSGSDELDTGAPSGVGAEVAQQDSQLMKEKIQTLTLEKATLGKQLTNERQQLRIKESQIGQLKNQVAELQSENQKLIDDKQCLELERVTEDHRSLSLKGENAVLSKQLELVRERMRETTISQQARIAALNDEVLMLKSEREAVQDKMSTLTTSHAHLRHQFHNLTSSLPHQQPRATRDGIQGLLDDLSEKNESMLRLRETKLRQKEQENRSLIVKLTDAAAVIVKLEEENKQLHSENRKAHEKIAELQCELEFGRDREVTAHQQLSDVIRRAERIKAEKDALAKIAKVQRRSAEKAVSSEMESSLTISNLENKLQACEQALLELERTSAVKKKDHHHHRKKYEEEIKLLRNMLTRKQNQMEQLAQEKRAAESQLDLVWRASSSSGGTLGLLKSTSQHRTVGNSFNKSFS